MQQNLENYEGFVDQEVKTELDEGGGEEDDEGEGTQADKSDGQSVRRDRRDTWLTRTWAYEMMAERVWPNIRHFLDSSFTEPSKERAFQKEVGQTP